MSRSEIVFSILRGIPIGILWGVVAIIFGLPSGILVGALLCWFTRKW